MPAMAKRLRSRRFGHPGQENRNRAGRLAGGAAGEFRGPFARGTVPGASRGDDMLSESFTSRKGRAPVRTVPHLRLRFHLKNRGAAPHFRRRGRPVTLERRQGDAVGEFYIFRDGAGEITDRPLKLFGFRKLARVLLGKVEGTA